MTTGLTRFAPQFLGLLRIATALTFMEHGTQKLFQFPAMGRFGGGGGPGGPGAKAASTALQQGAEAVSSAMSSAVDTASSALSSAVDTASSMIASAPPPTGGPAGAGGGMPASMQTTFLIAGILEAFGGLALVLGLLTRPVAFILAGECAVIFWWMHFGQSGNIFPISNGGESAVLFCFTFLYLVFAGPGAFAVDGLFGRKTTA